MCNFMKKKKSRFNSYIENEGRNAPPAMFFINLLYFLNILSFLVKIIILTKFHAFLSIKFSLAFFVNFVARSEDKTG